MKEFKTTCRGCHGGCIYTISVDGSKVVKASPAIDGPLNRGRGCIKGLTIIEQMYHPNRLLYPMKSVGGKESGKWKRISWAEAYDTIAGKVNYLRDTYGPECIATISGTGRHLLPYLARFARAIGTPNVCSAGSCICMGPRRSAGVMTSGLFCGVDYYGSVRPGGILVWGANPAISGADGELQWLIRDAVREGIPMLVIDPMPTELALQAEIWLRIRPGTDGALALCILNVLIQEKLYDRDFVKEYTIGFEKLASRCQEFSMEKTSEITGISENQILAAARWIAKTKPLGLEQGCAFEQSVNSIDTSRSIVSILAITGNYDVPGGFVESMEIAPAGLPLRELDSAVRERGLHGGFPFTKNRITAHPYYLLEAMRVGKPYQVRCLFSHADNTLLSLPDSQHTYEALKHLEFFVYMDFFMTPTGELADIILPAAMWPEVDCVFAMPEFGDQVLLSQQRCTQTGECKSDEDFFIELCERAGWDYGYTSQWEIMEEQIRVMGHRRPELANVRLSDLREKGYIAPKRTYYNYRKNGFHTPSGKFEFASSIMQKEGLDPVPNWHEPPETPFSAPEIAKEYPLILITGGRRQPFFLTNNRQIKTTRNMEPFPHCRMNPKTAEQYGIKEGQWAYIETRRGRITQKVKLVPKMDCQVVQCDAGWWYPEAGGPEYGWRESNANMLTILAPPYDSYAGSFQERALLCKIYPNLDCRIEERYQSSWLAQ